MTSSARADELKLKERERTILGDDLEVYLGITGLVQLTYSVQQHGSTSPEVHSCVLGRRVT